MEVGRGAAGGQRVAEALGRVQERVGVVVGPDDEPHRGAREAVRAGDEVHPVGHRLGRGRPDVVDAEVAGEHRHDRAELHEGADEHGGPHRQDLLDDDRAGDPRPRGPAEHPDRPVADPVLGPQRGQGRRELGHGLLVGRAVDVEDGVGEGEAHGLLGIEGPGAAEGQAEPDPPGVEPGERERGRERALGPRGVHEVPGQDQRRVGARRGRRAQHVGDAGGGAGEGRGEGHGGLLR